MSHVCHAYTDAHTATAARSTCTLSRAQPRAHAGASVSLEPGEAKDLSVVFKALPWARKDDDASAERAVTAKIAVKVLDNRYEASNVLLRGATFETDVSIEDLPESGEDELKFGELNLPGDALEAAFAVRNLRPKTVKYEWPDHASVTFSPKVGHLPPGGSRFIRARFDSAGSKLAVDEALHLKTTQIDITPPATADTGSSRQSLDVLQGPWDCDARIEREATPAERAASRRPVSSRGRATDGGSSRRPSGQ